MVEILDNFLSKKQEQNSKQILNCLMFLLNIRLKKIEIFDAFVNEKVWVHYLCIEDNNYPISKEHYEILKSLGINAIIV